MTTIKDIETKIQDISSKYLSGKPHIYLDSFASELNATKGEIMPHLEELHTQGLITFHSPSKDIFSLAGSPDDGNGIDPQLDMEQK